MSELRELFALGIDSDDSKHINLRHIRALRPEELDRASTVQALLHRMTNGSGLKHLRQIEADFHQSVENWETATRSNQVHQLGRQVQRDFKTWFSAFRALDDHTSAWLSKTYGKESEAFAAFKRSLNEEYDSNFAYRLCATLRNASEHVSNVINDIASTVRLGPDGKQEHVAKLQFDGPKLCEQFPGLKASVRHELSALKAPLQVEAVLGAATLSCERAHCRLVLALWNDLESAVSFCGRLADEAKEVGGQFAIFVNSEAFTYDGAPFLLRYNPKDLADLVRQNRWEADKVLALGPLEVCASDLT